MVFGYSSKSKTGTDAVCGFLDLDEIGCEHVTHRWFLCNFTDINYEQLE